MACYLNYYLNPLISEIKTLTVQARSVRPKTMYSKVMLEAIEGNLVSSIWRVSGELCIWLSSVFYYLHNLDKSIWIFLIVPHILLQILQNFWLTLVNHLKIYIGYTLSFSWTLTMLMISVSLWQLSLFWPLNTPLSLAMNQIVQLLFFNKDSFRIK